MSETIFHVMLKNLVWETFCILIDIKTAQIFTSINFLLHDLVENPIESNVLSTPSDEKSIFLLFSLNLVISATLNQTQGYIQEPIDL